jgi:hypothetical protein
MSTWGRRPNTETRDFGHLPYMANCKNLATLPITVIGIDGNLAKKQTWPPS